MGVKEYLNEIRHLNAMINNKLAEKEELRHMRITACYTDMPKGSGAEEDKICKVVENIARLDDEITEMIDNLVDKKREAIEYLNKVPSFKNSHLLESRYLRGRKWPDIAEEFDVSERNIHRMHSNALIEFEKVYRNKN